MISRKDMSQDPEVVAHQERIRKRKEYLDEHSRENIELFDTVTINLTRILNRFNEAENS